MGVYPSRYFEKEAAKMVRNVEAAKRQRLREIEDRKIEILLQTGKANRSYADRIIKLDSEYKRLDEEHLRLYLELHRKKEHNNNSH
jgi:hypothetical protein